MRVSEWKDSIVFLHEVGAWGLRIVPTAFMSPSWPGCPPPSSPGRKRVLRALEEGREGHKPLARIDDLPLFSALRSETRPSRQSAVEDRLAGVLAGHPCAQKPLFELIYELKLLLK